MDQSKLIEGRIQALEARIQWAQNAKAKVLASSMRSTEQFELVRRHNQTILFCQGLLEKQWAERAALAKQQSQF